MQMILNISVTAALGIDGRFDKLLGWGQRHISSRHELKETIKK